MSDRPAADKSPERRHVWDDPKNVRRLIWTFVVVCAVTVLTDLVVHRHPTFEGGEMELERWFGFYAFYGFVACVALVLAAKEMRKVLMRDEGYYGAVQPDPDPAPLDGRTAGSDRGAGEGDA